jgi:hypothetical protein
VAVKIASEFGIAIGPLAQFDTAIGNLTTGQALNITVDYRIGSIETSSAGSIASSDWQALIGWLIDSASEDGLF